MVTWLLAGAGVVAAVVLGAAIVLGIGSPGTTSDEVSLVAAGSVATDRFTDSIATGPLPTFQPAALLSRSTPAAIAAIGDFKPQPGPRFDDSIGGRSVDGSTPGLYAGTRERGDCDPGRLVSQLEASPDKAAAWAQAEGIDKTGLASFVATLTPVLLRQDTLVSFHGYRNGGSKTRQAVLQAGTAVLADASGVPRTRCESGNPLTAPAGPADQPRLRGTPWAGFSPSGVVSVAARASVDALVLIDAQTQQAFARPVGSTGAADGALSTASCELYPKISGCGPESPTPTFTPAPTPSAASPAATLTAPPTATVPPTTQPTAPPTSPPTPAASPVELFSINSLMGVSQGPTEPSVFTLTQDTFITMIRTYHYGDTSAPGTIALQSADGTVYGPFQAAGVVGQGGVDNAYWEAPVNQLIPAGEYTFVDSRPETWSVAFDTGGRGICWVYGYPAGGGN